MIVLLAADVVGSSPAAHQFFFTYFPLTHSVSFFFLYIFFFESGPGVDSRLGCGGHIFGEWSWV